MESLREIFDGVRFSIIRQKKLAPLKIRRLRPSVTTVSVTKDYEEGDLIFKSKIVSSVRFDPSLEKIQQLKEVRDNIAVARRMMPYTASYDILPYRPARMAEGVRVDDNLDHQIYVLMYGLCAAAQHLKQNLMWTIGQAKLVEEEFVETLRAAMPPDPKVIQQLIETFPMYDEEFMQWLFIFLAKFSIRTWFAFSEFPQLFFCGLISRMRFIGQGNVLISCKSDVCYVYAAEKLCAGMELFLPPSYSICAPLCKCCISASIFCKNEFETSIHDLARAASMFLFTAHTKQYDLADECLAMTLNFFREIHEGGHFACMTAILVPVVYILADSKFVSANCRRKYIKEIYNYVCVMTPMTYVEFVALHAMQVSELHTDPLRKKETHALFDTMLLPNLQVSPDTKRFMSNRKIWLNK